MIKKLNILALLILISFRISAQEFIVSTIEANNVCILSVPVNITVTQLADQFNVSKDLLMLFNDVKEDYVFEVNEEVIIPIHSDKIVSTNINNKLPILYYQMLEDESLLKICKRFYITEDHLKKMNPGLSYTSPQKIKLGYWNIMDQDSPSLIANSKKFNIKDYTSRFVNFAEKTSKNITGSVQKGVANFNTGWRSSNKKVRAWVREQKGAVQSILPNTKKYIKQNNLSLAKKLQPEIPQPIEKNEPNNSLSVNNELVEDTEEEDEESNNKEVINNVSNNLNSESRDYKALWFYSGSTNTNFTVFTNVATKGEIIEIMNPATGKSIKAKVLGGLRADELKSGTELILSDNAKGALGAYAEELDLRIQR